MFVIYREIIQTLFTISSQLTPPSPFGLKSLCALGITQADSTLTMAVLQELFSNEDPKTQADVSHLMALSHCLLEVC